MTTENNAYVTVSAANKVEKYAVNGGLSVQEALAMFFRCDRNAVAGRIEGQVVRLDTNTVAANAIGTTQLSRTNDSFISLYPAEVARGGVKGA